MVLKKVRTRGDAVKLWCKIVPWFFGCVVRFLLFHRDISFRRARQIRAALMHDRTWHWYEFGFQPWFFINLTLLTLEEKKGNLAARIKSGARAIDAIGRVRVIFSRRQDRDVQVLLSLWNEFKIQDEQAFVQRDKTFFMQRKGSLFPDAVRAFFEEAIVLRASDYLMLKYLCVKASLFFRELISHIGKLELTLVEYFLANEDECGKRIIRFKAIALEMAATYVDNMVSFCLENHLEASAAQWAMAGKSLVRLRETDPLPETEGVLRRELQRFFDEVDCASTQVYLKYEEQARAARKPQLALAAADTQPIVPNAPDADPLDRWPYLHREGCGRFRFSWSRKALTIKDVDHRDAAGHTVQFGNITAPQALDVIEQLVKTYAAGYDRCILPLSSLKWQSSMGSGDAASFIRIETQTWNEANPSATKAERAQHKRQRRIIPDKQPLRTE